VSEASTEPGVKAVGHTFGVDPDKARDLLAGERERIERELAALDAPEQSPIESVDPGDPAPQLLDAEIAGGLAERLRDELAALERAEARLAEGRYGLSVQSGEPIPDARLRAIPWAERTAEEQARYEASGG
jgi:DnaK suppressor protein